MDHFFAQAYRLHYNELSYSFRFWKHKLRKMLKERNQLNTLSTFRQDFLIITLICSSAQKLFVQGWNSSWDRYVAESFILQDIQEHRLLQKELADADRTILYENPTCSYTCRLLLNTNFTNYRKENRRTTKQRIGALRGADPKFRTDSESSSVEEGDSGTRSSFEEDSPECDNSSEPVDSQDAAANENTIVIFNIPDSIKQLLEEDGIKIKCRKKVRSTNSLFSNPRF